MGVRAICIKDCNGKMFFKGRITSIPLKEEYLLKRSSALFDDPEPCMIHRSAIMKMVYLELEDCLMKIAENDKYEIEWQSLPENVRESIDVSGDQAYICFEV